MKPLVVLTYPLRENLVREELSPSCRVVIADTPAKLRKILPQADALVSLVTDRVDKKLLTLGKRLKVVGNHAVGYDNIDLAECARRKIAVVNTPEVLNRSTAELTLALTLAAARRFREGMDLCNRRKFRGWTPDMLWGQELRGKTAVIVGKGRIGSEAARLFRGIGMKVDSIGSKESEAGIRRKLFKADVLSFHCPLTPQTHHWLNTRRIGFLPKTAIVINTARGPIIDEKALISALRRKKLFAAGLDVYEFEPWIPPALARLPNVVLLPHLGSATQTAREAMARTVFQGVVGILNGKRPWNTVRLKTKK
ncbi:D-glycerate dehydrogenase [bacterium]|jgi:glyoxylate reductase|nr:D-glycerate dehydrogenase [bacterium]